MGHSGLFHPDWAKIDQMVQNMLKWNLVQSFSHSSQNKTKLTTKWLMKRINVPHYSCLNNYTKAIKPNYPSYYNQCPYVLCLWWKISKTREFFVHQWVKWSRNKVDLKKKKKGNQKGKPQIQNYIPNQ